jgi:hypothetical protein
MLASIRMSITEIYAIYGRTHSSDYDGVRVQLFDAYDPGDHAPYRRSRTIGFRRSSARNGETF